MGQLFQSGTDPEFLLRLALMRRCVSCAMGLGSFYDGQGMARREPVSTEARALCVDGAVDGGSASNAQAWKAEPGVAAPVTRAMKQKQRSARFLARRGIGQTLVSPNRTSSRYGPSRYGRGAAEMRAEARTEHHALAAAQGSSGNTNLTAPWQPVGPAQVTTTTHGALTGRVSSLAVDPSDPSGNTVYVGTTGGGVWRSANAAGNSASVAFTPLTDTLSAYAATSIVSLSIGAVSVQPGGTGVVLAGTGDPNDATDSYYGAGPLRSSDGGVTWSLITQSSDVLAGGKQDFTFSGNGFAGFAWSTANPNLVVAAVSQAAEGVEVNAGASLSMMGIYYSQDAGQTWYMATIADAGNTVQSNQTVFLTRGNAVTSVVVEPGTADIFCSGAFPRLLPVAGWHQLDARGESAGQRADNGVLSEQRGIDWVAGLSHISRGADRAAGYRGHVCSYHRPEQSGPGTVAGCVRVEREHMLVGYRDLRQPDRRCAARGGER